ncbi:hypothetical protein GGR52DRAFT_585586 [Hypoxylon sp. FL1284]|nr:hypothetical protein GGR52DRAFT_585586 [Hypoxylon sp. FL1284]
MDGRVNAQFEADIKELMLLTLAQYDGKAANLRSQGRGTATAMQQLQNEARAQFDRRSLRLAALHSVPQPAGLPMADFPAQIRSRLTTADRLQLAVEYPALYQNDFFAADAQLQLANMLPAFDVTAAPDAAEPMLSVTIRENRDVATVTAILRAYEAALGRRNVSAVYQYRAHQPPLHLALDAGRADVARTAARRTAHGARRRVRAARGRRARRDRVRVGAGPRVRDGTAGGAARARDGVGPAARGLRGLARRLRGAVPRRRARARPSTTPDVAGAVLYAAWEDDRARRVLRAALPQVVYAVAEHEWSRTPAEAGREPERPGHDAALPAVRDAGRLARSDDWIYKLVFDYRVRVDPVRVWQVAGRGNFRAANVIVQACMLAESADRAQGGGGNNNAVWFVDRFVESYAPWGVAGSYLASTAACTGLFDSLERLDLLPRLVYAAARERDPAAANALLWELAGTGVPASSAQALYAAIFWGRGSADLAAALAEFESDREGVDSRAEALARPRVVRGYSGALAEPRNFFDRFATGGWSALDVAVLFNNFRAVNSLLQCGADPADLHPDIRQQLLRRRVFYDGFADTGIDGLPDAGIDGFADAGNDDQSFGEPLPLLRDLNIVPDNYYSLIPAPDVDEFVRATNELFGISDWQ